jgi:hypothetical protein
MIQTAVYRTRSALAFLMILVVLAITAVVVPREATRLRTSASDTVGLLATQTALIMQGTFFPFVSPAWVSEVMGAFIDPVREDFTGSAVDTPEQFWPVTGITSMSFNKSIQAGYAIIDERLDQTLASEGFRIPVNVFGYSQSAVIASVLKRDLDAEYANRKDVPAVTFTMIGNPLRPNGGFLSRFGIANEVLTPWIDLRSTPTDTPYSTTDIARQYDVWADFPTYPLNLLATINAAFGTWNHWYLPESLPPGFYSDVIETVSLDPSSPDYVSGTTAQVYGDTTYYLIPSEHLPMYYPLRWLGLGPVVDVFEPLTKVFVELGYDRTTPYGEQTRMRLIPDIGNLAHIDQFFADVSQALDEGGQALVELLTPTRTEHETAGPDPLPAAGVVASEPMPTAVPVTTGTPDPDVPVSGASVPAAEEPSTGPRRRQQSDPTPPVQEPVRAATPESASPDLPVLDAVESSVPADLNGVSAPDDVIGGSPETRISRRGAAEAGTGPTSRRGLARSAAAPR